MVVIAFLLIMSATCAMGIQHTIELSFSVGDSNLDVVMDKRRNLGVQVDELCALNTVCVENLNNYLHLFDADCLKRIKTSYQNKPLTIHLFNVQNSSERESEGKRLCGSVLGECFAILTNTLAQFFDNDLTVSWEDKSFSNWVSIYPLNDNCICEKTRSVDYFNRGHLMSLYKTNVKVLQFQEAYPWPHIVLDNIFDVDKLRGVQNDVLQAYGDKGSNAAGWRKFTSGNQIKYGTSDDRYIGKMTRDLMAELKSSEFVTFLEQLTGIRGLITDPFDKGGGMHVIEEGGMLNVHTDFPFHSELRLWRRVNVLVYLNDVWEEDWGGQLELCHPTNASAQVNQERLDVYPAHMNTEKDVQVRCPLKIDPLFNRMVIFATTNISFHGHPRPLRSSGATVRKSIAIYYYSSDMEVDDSVFGSTTNFVDIL